MSLTTNLLPFRAPVVLGLALGARRIGLCVLDREDLLSVRVLNVGQLHSREGKEARFRQVATELFDDLHVTDTALVGIERHDAEPAFLTTLRAWFEDEARHRLVAISHLSAEEVRRDVVKGRVRPNNRNLAETLCQTFPELHAQAPSAVTGPGGAHLPELAATPSSLPTNRERYWQRMFLALGAAVLTRDRVLKEAVSD